MQYAGSVWDPGEGADTGPGLRVGQGVEAGQEIRDGAAVLLDELDGALSQRGAVRVANHHGADDVGEQDAGAVPGGAESEIGLGRDELRGGPGELLETALEPMVAGLGKG